MTDEDIKYQPTTEELKSEVDKLKEQEIAESEALVTSLAKEEEKTGKKVEPKPEDFFNMLVRNHTMGLQKMKFAMRLSKRGMFRVLIALLQMPDMDTGKMASNLQGPIEKELFQAGQLALRAKTTIEQLFAMQAARQKKLDEAEKAQANETKTNEQITNETKEQENV